MTKEIEQVKQEIQMLQSKLAFLEEMEKYNEGPAKEAFKGIYGVYPKFPSDARFGYFKSGYEAHKSLVGDANKIINDAGMSNCRIDGNPPNGCSSWSNWYELFGSKGILNNLKLSSLDNNTLEPYHIDDPEYCNGIEWDEKDNPNLEKIIDKMVEERKAQKLWNRLQDELGFADKDCDKIVDLVEDWILDEQSSAGSQNVNIELLVEGFNDAIRKMKEMLS